MFSNMVVLSWWVINSSSWQIRQIKKIKKDNKTTGIPQEWTLRNTLSILYYVAMTFTWAINKARANGWFIIGHTCIYTQNTHHLDLNGMSLVAPYCVQSPNLMVPQQQMKPNGSLRQSHLPLLMSHDYRLHDWAGCEVGEVCRYSISSFSVRLSSMCLVYIYVSVCAENRHMMTYLERWQQKKAWLTYTLYIIHKQPNLAWH